MKLSEAVEEFDAVEFVQRQEKTKEMHDEIACSRYTELIVSQAKAVATAMVVHNGDFNRTMASFCASLDLAVEMGVAIERLRTGAKPSEPAAKEPEWFHVRGNGSMN